MVEPLALFGGTPVRDELLPYGRQSITAADIDAVAAVLRSDWLTTGPEVDAFETAFAAAAGARYAVAFSSGTAALHGAAVAAGLGPGDEAITTPLTFCATANCVLYAGARPVFADVEPASLALDPDRVERLVGPQTRAVITVDYAGHPVDLAPFRRLADRHGLCLIADASHAVGARDHGQPAGRLADMTTFSFHPVKHLAAGEGGMVTTDDDARAARLRRFRNHGLTSEARARRDGAAWAYDMVELGFNYRLTDIAAALGRSQLARLDANLARRRAIAARYTDAFATAPELRLLPERAGSASAWHLFPVRFDTGALGTDRDTILAALRAEGIGVNVHYVPVPALAFYRERGYDPATVPHAQHAADRLISLPMFHGMTDADVGDVRAAVHKVLACFREQSAGPGAGRG